MIIIKLGLNRTLGLEFPREVKEPSRQNPRLVRATWCEIHRLAADGKSEAIVARGYAQCAKKDRHSNELGRKKALARALKQYLLPKAERTIVWDTYRNRPRHVSRQPVKVQPVEDAINMINEAFNPVHARQAHLDLNAGEIH